MEPSRREDLASPASRRRFVSTVIALSAVRATAVLALSTPATAALAQADSRSPARSDTALKIGVIGAGNIGGTLAELWVKAGHRVMLSSRHPERLEGLASRLGPLASVSTPAEAAARLGCSMACQTGSSHQKFRGVS